MWNLVYIKYTNRYTYRGIHVCVWEGANVGMDQWILEMTWIWMEAAMVFFNWRTINRREYPATPICLQISIICFFKPSHAPKKKDCNDVLPSQMLCVELKSRLIIVYTAVKANSRNDKTPGTKGKKMSVIVESSLFGL